MTPSSPSSSPPSTSPVYTGARQAASGLTGAADLECARVGRMDEEQSSESPSGEPPAHALAVSDEITLDPSHGPERSAVPGPDVRSPAVPRDAGHRVAGAALLAFAVEAAVNHASRPEPEAEGHAPGDAQPLHHQPRERAGRSVVVDAAERIAVRRDPLHVGRARRVRRSPRRLGDVRRAERAVEAADAARLGQLEPPAPTDGVDRERAEPRGGRCTDHVVRSIAARGWVRTASPSPSRSTATIASSSGSAIEKAFSVT